MPTTPQLVPRPHRASPRRGSVQPEPAPGWCRQALAGRLTELVAGPGSASLTLASALVLDAQLQGEPVAWLSTPDRVVFPPDLAAWGIDLDALAVVRVPPPAAGEPSAVARAGDRLARSGAFGLLVLDLEPGAPVPMPLQSRLLGLAIKHDIAVVFLTARGGGGADGGANGAGIGTAGLGSLVSLRAETSRRRVAEDRFAAGLRVTKDKRRAPGWVHVEECCGPPGLR